ncbi:multidrug ABC transporter ATP-binding protein [Enterococcus plantarum]|uniref:ABC transporter ATP-binding protein n=1 Tax=Enterococcus TaxID=1350 RepID=UPI00084D304C|nr:ABC transporter ATP-binding protein [Enterococcus plantarum]MBO0424003.1 ABC transporter ATP-binding protein [Enterococcus plantarum]MBO0468853.1 ABC transporter ATP-binding protein [Enterococcus plantarum]OEG18278.1 multidrug ABC transporter ATP-binding protein [Enterococcus plantarum]
MLVVDRISKKIKKYSVLKNVSLTFEEGHVYGLIGQNGSGKTMLLRAISGLIRVQEGTITYNDQILGKDFDFLPSLGLIIEHEGLEPSISGVNNLKLLSEINKIANKKDIDLALTKVGLDPNDRRPVKKYSLGMRQKLIIAQAIFENPKVLLLDEPTNGLDDDAIDKFYQLIDELKTSGRIIVIASHNKKDIEELCDTIVVIKDGSIVS